MAVTLTLLSRWRPLPYRNQSIDLLCKSMYWFLYDNGLRHEKVKLPQEVELLSLKNFNNYIIIMTNNSDDMRTS